MNIDRLLLKNLRTKRGMSQEELALAAGMSVRTVQRIESHRAASLESRKAIAAVFGIGVHDLLERDAPPILRDEQHVLAGSVFLVIAAVFATMFGLAEILGPIHSLDSRDLLVLSDALAAGGFGVLAIRRLRLAHRITA